MSGLFVTIDGPGGSGKSTLAEVLANLLVQAGRTVHRTTEPSTRMIGAFTRQAADLVHGYALACLVAADRYDHLSEEIRPALTAGATVVCDRYLASSLVLQRLDGVPVDFILNVNHAATPPDLAVILTAAPSLLAARLAQRGAHHRFETDPAIPAREVELYREAVRFLDGLGVPVMVIDTGQVTASAAARRIARTITGPASSVASHG